MCPQSLERTLARAECHPGAGVSCRIAAEGHTQGERARRERGNVMDQPELPIPSELCGEDAEELGMKVGF